MTIFALIIGAFINIAIQGELLLERAEERYKIARKKSVPARHKGKQGLCIFLSY